MKNYAKIVLFTLTSFVCGATLADTNTTAPTAPAAPTSSSSLEAFLGTLYTDTMDYLSASDYQKNISLQNAQTANTAKTIPTVQKFKQNDAMLGLGDSTTEGAQVNLLPNSVTPTAAVRAKAAYETQANLVDSLRGFASTFSPSNLSGGEWTTVNGRPLKKYQEENSIKNLTIGDQKLIEQCENGQKKTCPWQASDSVFMKKEKIDSSNISSSQKKYLFKPTSTSADSYLDFSSFMLPQDNSYTPNQEIAAKEFLKYAAQSTQNFTAVFDGVSGLSTLQVSPSALADFKTQPAYYDFMFGVRSFLALRSMNLSILNQLIAERTPMPGLGVAAGLPNATQNTPASPLQVEAYQANHQLENPNWYQQIQNASPATIQREMLVSLAEIKHQNYQAHLDRENILAALTELNMQMSMENSNAFIQKEKQNIQSAINAATGKVSKK